LSDILVAEDEPAYAELIKVVLEDAGHQVTTAADGAEAWERLQSQPFDLLLTDIRMPRMDGLELLSHARQLPAPPRMVVLTSDDAPETLLKAIREQALRYATKPMQPAQLAELVKQALAEPADREFHVISATPQWVELLVPCERTAAERIQGLMARLDADLPADVRETVGQVFRELLLNAIEWGGQLDPNRHVRIAYLRAKRMLLYRIADPGPGFRIEELPHAAISNPPDEPMSHALVREEKGLRPGGLGLLLVSKLADELLYNDARNEVVFVKYLPE
jgi:CheY-like chemotaxis protein/anti-sigma regulatory factor (Ser/Thr protein kinase)